MTNGIGCKVKKKKIQKDNFFVFDHVFEGLRIDFQIISFTKYCLL